MDDSQSKNPYQRDELKPNEIVILKIFTKETI